ncbi:MAG: hypothetical protein M9930_12890 [Anaerolineae bacterium]|nr:hypothetical protein [Anaerolineae bacterium]
MSSDNKSNNSILIILVGGLAVVLALLGGALLFGGVGDTDPEPVAANMGAVSAEADTVRSADLPQVNATLPPPAEPTDLPVATVTNTPIATDTPVPTATPLPTATPTPAPVVQAPAAAVAAPTDTPVPVPAGPCHLAEQNGMLLIDIDSAPAVGGWVFENSAAGFFGDGYYTYRGEESLRQPNNSVLSYPIYINNPGVYEVHLWNYHDHPDTSEGNDAWLQISGGVRSWVKTFSGFRDQWNWDNLFEPSPGNHTEPVVSFPAAGAYTLEVTGRSHGFSIDRIIVVKPEMLIHGRNPDLPQSPCQ